jgi:hypothetical protein
VAEELDRAHATQEAIIGAAMGVEGIADKVAIA